MPAGSVNMPDQPHGDLDVPAAQDRDDFPDECCHYYKIEDILADAQDILEEQRKARGDDED